MPEDIGDLHNFEKLYVWLFKVEWFLWENLSDLSNT